jgi:hypothetical protein
MLCFGLSVFNEHAHSKGAGIRQPVSSHEPFNQID